MIDLGESDKLLEDFFGKAPHYIRNDFMQSLSWRLLYGNFKIDDRLCSRLRAFLDWRIEQAKNDLSNLNKYSDLEYFSWILTSDKLNNYWAIPKLIDVLKLVGTVKHCDKFLEHLGSLTSQMSQAVVQCLSLLADSSKSREWFASYHNHHYRNILQAALESEDQDTHQAARSLINRLVARSLGDYRDLLQ